MYNYTLDHQVQLLDAHLHPLTRRGAARADFLWARFSSHYGTTPIDAGGDSGELWVLLYDSGYSALPVIPVHFSDYVTCASLHSTLRDRPLAWLFGMTGWPRTQGHPPYGRLLLARVDSRRGCGLSQLAVGQINAVFCMLALRTPGVWHGKLCAALGVRRPGPKTRLFRGAVIDGTLVPHRLSDGGIVLYPVKRNR